MVVLEESFLGLRFSKKFLAEFCLIFHILSCKYFVESFGAFFILKFHLVLAQIFSPFNWLCFPWCNVSCKFSIIGLNSGLGFSFKVLSFYLSQEILIFPCKALFLEKDGTCFLVQDFVYSS